jgi:hypothetical protein
MIVLTYLAIADKPIVLSKTLVLIYFRVNDYLLFLHFFKCLERLLVEMYLPHYKGHLG